MMDAATDSGPVSNNSFITTTEMDKVTRATFLIAFILVGFVCNCVLLATLVHNTTLRNVRIFVISLAIANLLDAIANIPMTLGPSIKENYEYSHLICKIHAFGLQITSISIIYGLLGLVVDR